MPNPDRKGGNYMLSFTEQPPRKRAKFEITLNSGKEALENDGMWDDLDVTEIDECIEIATQMCLDEQLDTCMGSESHSSKDVSVDFPLGLNNKLAVSKSKSGSAHTNAGLHDNKYSDFMHPLPKNYSSLSSNHSIYNKVYNSVPFKGRSENEINVNFPKGCQLFQASDDPFFKSDTNKSDNISEFCIKKLKEDILLKQGEVSLLRDELRKKASALESEKVDRCAAIEAAEKRGKEKLKAHLKETEAKTKHYESIIEKLEGNLHFKGIEVGELESKCRRLEQQMASKDPANLPGPDFVAISQKCFKVAAPGNFASQFDFTRKVASVRDAQIQTEAASRKQRKGLLSSEAGYASNSICKIQCLFYQHHHGTESTPTMCSSFYPSAWLALMSQTFDHNCVSSGGCHRVKADELLEELLLLVVNTVREVTEGHLRTGNLAHQNGNLLIGSLQVFGIVGDYLPDSETLPLSILLLHNAVLLSSSENSGNNCEMKLRLFRVAVQLISNRNISSEMESHRCMEFLKFVTNLVGSLQSLTELLTILGGLVLLGNQEWFLNTLCQGEVDSTQTDDSANMCMVKCICCKVVLLAKSPIDHSGIAVFLLDLVGPLIRLFPDWLHGKCQCSSHLVSTLLHEVSGTLHFLSPYEALNENDVGVLLTNCILILHQWLSKDATGYWKRVAPLPSYTNVMHAFLIGQNWIKPDQHTVELLYDLFEVEDSPLNQV